MAGVRHVFPLYQVQGDDSPAIGVRVSGESIDGAACRWVHSEWGTIDVVASGNVVTLPIDAARAAIAIGSYTWHLILNPDTPGARETVARGAWIVVGRNG
jgi:hypothetical protein